MSGNHPTLKNKVSPHLESQLPDFVREDHALFSLFLKYYYEFLEAGELTLTGSNDYVIEEKAQGYNKVQRVIPKIR